MRPNVARPIQVEDEEPKIASRTAYKSIGVLLGPPGWQRPVLSTFHAFEILIRVAEGNSWIDAILETAPPRKGAKPKVLPSDMKDEHKDESVVSNQCFADTITC
uniref:SAM-dependent MTase TRM10-type domain-containing protein n=1 Tax=Glossina palpalis gambiensis TaxID=67801 RepID=A0A1B0C0P9_9MUSC